MPCGTILPLEVIESIVNYSLPPVRYDCAPREKLLRSYSLVSKAWLGIVRNDRRRYLTVGLGDWPEQHLEFGSQAVSLSVGFAQVPMKFSTRYGSHYECFGGEGKTIETERTGRRRLRSRQDLLGTFKMQKPISTCCPAKFFHACGRFKCLLRGRIDILVAPSGSRTSSTIL